MVAETPTVRYAGFWKRFHAYKIDVILVMILCYLADRFVGSASAQGMADFARTVETMQSQLNGQAVEPGSFMDMLVHGLIVGIIVSAIYNIGFVASKYQATPGKRFYKLIVVMEDGSKPTLVQSAVRHLFSGFSTLTGGLGWLSIVYTARKQALHDALAKTYVVFREAV